MVVQQSRCLLICTRLVLYVVDVWLLCFTRWGTRRKQETFFTYSQLVSLGPHKFYFQKAMGLGRTPMLLEPQ